jgi:hypothetical protein
MFTVSFYLAHRILMGRGVNWVYLASPARRQTANARRTKEAAPESQSMLSAGTAPVPC